MPNSEKEYLSRTDVANIFQVSPATVSRWARQGHLPWVGTLGGHRRYPRGAVTRLRARLGDTERRPATTAVLLDRNVDLSSAVAEEHSLIETRLHGRAGQGFITVGDLVTEAALRDCKYFQAFPEFGAERSGAPMEAFVRISTRPIHTHAPVLEPGIVVVLDRTLLSQIPVFRGMAPQAVAVVNYPCTPSALRQAYAVPKGVRLATVDATAIAQDTLRRPFPNMPMLGALLKVRPLVPPDLMAEVSAYSLEKRFPRELVEANVAAFWRGYEEVRLGKGLARNKEVPS